MGGYRHLNTSLDFHMHVKAELGHHRSSQDECSTPINIEENRADGPSGVDRNCGHWFGFV